MRSALSRSLPIAYTALGLLGASVATMFAFPDHGVTLLIALVGLTAYSVAAPVMVIRFRSFWVGAPMAVASWGCLFLALAAASEWISRRPVGDDGMVMLLPFTLFPVLVAVAGLVRLVAWLRSRT